MTSAGLLVGLDEFGERIPNGFGSLEHVEHGARRRVEPVVVARLEVQDDRFLDKVPVDDVLGNGDPGVEQ